MRLGVPPRDVDDLLQEVFVVLYRKRHDYDPHRKLRPWLCGIAFRVASAWKRRAFHREVPTALDEQQWPTTTLDEKHAAHHTVQRALRTLSFEHRAVVVLCDLEGYTAPEAGELIGIPAGTVYSRLHEGRRLFAAAVRAEGGAG